MFRHVAPAALLVLSLASVEVGAGVPHELARFCASLFGAARGPRAREFDAALAEAAEGHVDEALAAFVGERILEFPEVYLRAAETNAPSPVAPLVSSPALARAFFAGHPHNGLVGADLLALAQKTGPERYRDVIADPMRTVVTTPALDLAKSHSAFDVAVAQARALDLLRWADLHDESVVAAAFAFLEPKLTRFKTPAAVRALGRRAYSAADLIHRLTRAGEISDARVEWLVAAALNLGHPFRVHYWTALVASRLDDAQIERLAHAWASPVLLERERTEVRQNAARLIEVVEDLIRRTPRKFKNLKS